MAVLEKNAVRLSNLTISKSESGQLYLLAYELSLTACSTATQNKSVHKNNTFILTIFIEITIFRNIHKLEIYAQINSGCTLTTRQKNYCSRTAKISQKVA